MTDILIGLPIVGLVAAVLGWGWASTLSMIPPGGPLGNLFRAWTLTIVMSSIVWAWAYPFNISARVAAAAIVAIAGTGYLAALFTRSLESYRINRAGVRALAVAFGVVVIDLLPCVTSLTKLTVAQRIGPDVAGYAAATDALAQGETRSIIEHNLLQGIGAGTVQQALSPVTKGIYAVPSFTVQVVNEFLTGAGRWAFPGTASSALTIVGQSHLWSMLSLLCGFAIIVTCVGVWTTIVERTGSRLAGYLGMTLVGLSAAVLNNWHEGDLAEIWIMPCCVLLVQPLIRIAQNPGRVSQMLPIALGIAGVTPVIRDDLFPYAILFGVAAGYSIFVLGRGWLTAWWPIVLAAIAGGLAVEPASGALVAQLSRSLSESGTAGWPMPQWSSLAQTLGIGNPYGTSSATPIDRRSWAFVLDGIANAIVGGYLITIVRYGGRRVSILLVATVGTIAAVYVKTRYVDHSYSYQYFKTIVTVAPVGACAIGELLGTTLNHSDATRTPIVRRNLTGATVMLIVAVALSGVTYVGVYWVQSTRVPQAYSALANSSAAQRAFAEYNVLQPLLPTSHDGGAVSLGITSLGAEVDLNWINRNFGNTSTVLGQRVNNPVAMLVLDVECPQLQCIDTIPHSEIPFRGDGVALVRLSSSTEELSKLPANEWGQWANDTYRKTRGQPLIGMLPPP